MPLAVPRAPRPARPQPAGPPGRAGRTRSLRVAALAVALVALAAVPASAHDQLLSTDPADGSTLDHTPAAVTLVFSEKVLDISTTVVVSGPAGDVPASVAVDGGTVTATLTGDQPNGAYTVTWRIVSSDGHPVQGTFGYALAAPEPTPTPTPTATPTATDSTTSTPGPSPTASPDPSATPTSDAPTPPGVGADASTGSTTSAPLVVALAALAAVLGAGALWARRRTSRRTR